MVVVAHFLNKVHWSRYALAEVRIGRGGRGAVLPGAGESLFNLCYNKDMSSIKRFRILVVGAALFVSAFFRGQAVYAQDIFVQSFKLNPVNEVFQLGIGAGLSGSALICDKFLHIKENEYNAADWNEESIPGLERIFMRPYSKPLHIVGTATLGIALSMPALLALTPDSEWLTLGTMYLETLLLTNGIKEWAKLLVYRARPYMYFDGYPQDKLEDGDWNCSFPSGHTSLAFAGAAFTTMVFCRCFPTSDWQYVVAGVSFGIAAITGCLRMASGNHFLTDVLAGAIIGTACGFAVPHMHTETFYDKFQKKSGNARAALTPAGFNLTFQL